jgi:hypothetical protein
MGLIFSVGNPADVQSEPFAEQVRATLAKYFGESIVLDSSDAPYSSAEVAWSGWALLQEKAVQTITAEQAPHFLSMAAWFGCFVPTEVRSGALEFPGESLPMSVASLPALVRELELVGGVLGLPIDDRGLRQLARRYQDEDIEEDDFANQTYVELLLAAHEATRRRQVLWVIK